MKYYSGFPSRAERAMPDCLATVSWQRNGALFTDNRYSRAHEWRFDGGAVVRASSSPHIVRVPMSDPAAVDPEEAFVASLSSCHMLWFLSLAAAAGFTVDEYEDRAVGVLSRSAEGKLAITQVTLNPVVVFAGRRPSPQEFERLHELAHEECFIASSVKTELTCKAQMR